MPETVISIQETPWTLILSAQGADAALRRECLERIFAQYRMTIIRLFRFMGFRDYDDRDDLVQEFFLRFIEKDLLGKADPEKGRFRSYLKAVARRFVYDVRHREKGRHPLAGVPSAPPAPGSVNRAQIDLDECPDVDREANDVFDRQWARATLQIALTNFRRDCGERGLSHWATIFDRHTLPLAVNTPRPSLAESARLLGQTPKQTESCLTRANACFREHLRKVIRMSVGSDAEAEREMADLRLILSESETLHASNAG